MSVVRHILALEDEESHAELIERAFCSRRDEYSITLVSSIAQARASMAKSEPDLLLVDFYLPDGGGEEFMISLGGKYPVIMMTAFGDEALAVQSIKAGALDYVVKSPETFELLPHTADRALREWDLRTANRLAADTLRESEEHFRTMAEQLMDVLFSADINGIITYVSPYARYVFGCTDQEMIGRPFIEFLPEQEVAKAMEQAQADMTSGQATRNLQLTMKRKSGETFDGELNSTVLRKDGRNIGTMGLIRDISERKRLESEQQTILALLKLLNSDRDLHGLIRNACSFLATWSVCPAVAIRLREGAEYPYFDAQGFAKTFTTQENQLCTRDKCGKVVCDDKGKPVLECICGKVLCGTCDPAKSFYTPHGSFWTNSITELLACPDGAALPDRLRTGCNKAGYESVALIPLKVGSKTLGLIQLNDKQKNRFSRIQINFLERLANNISQAVLAAMSTEALHNSEEQYRELIENIDDVIFSMTATGIFTYISPAITRLTDYSAEDLIGKSFLELVSTEDLPEIAGHLKSLLLEKQRTDEYRITTKAGNIRWVQSVCRLTAQGEVTGRFTDITSRRMLEKQKDALMQADKMIALGTLVSGVAHEINNPNNFIMMNTPILGEVWRETLPILQEYFETHGDFVLGGISYSTMKDEIPELLTGIQEGSDRIKDIVKDLKRFVRMEPPDLSETVDINEVVRGATALLGSTIRKATYKFIANYCEPLPSIKGSFQRIEQVVINLIQNSCHALKDTGKSITVSTGYIEDADSVFIQIDDEGQGIAPENLKNLANPFFTTKSDSGGTGLGLSVSMGIVKDHGGALSFTSTLGKGTSAVVVLPVSKTVGG